MTNEELITICKVWRDRSMELTNKGIVDGAENVEIYDAIIEALGTQPCEDCISRSDVLKYTHIVYDDDGVGHKVIYTEDVEEILKELNDYKESWSLFSDTLTELRDFNTYDNPDVYEVCNFLVKYKDMLETHIRKARIK